MPPPTAWRRSPSAARFAANCCNPALPVSQAGRFTLGDRHVAPPHRHRRSRSRAGFRPPRACARKAFGPVVLLSDEKELPYQRPPLSKAFLKGADGARRLPLRAEQFYRDKRHRSAARRTATRIELAARRVELASGGRWNSTISCWRPAPGRGALEVSRRRSRRRAGLRNIADARAHPGAAGRGRAGRGDRRRLHRPRDRRDSARASAAR